MYNLNDIQEKFFSKKQITFRSSLNSESEVLDSDLTGISKSGRYFNSGVNSMINLENLSSLFPLLSEYNISAYDSGTTYSNYNTTFSLNDVVLESSKYYISVANSNTNNLVSDSDYWKETTLLSLILKDKIRSSIEVVLSELITPNFIEDNVYMYRIANTTTDIIENTDKLVGYRINPLSSDHLLFILNQVSLLFDSDETITFYLYNQNTLITSFDLSATANYLEWQDLATELNIESNRGAYYLFYDQKALNGQAIGDDTIFYFNMFNYANITPFEIDSVSDLSVFDESFLTYNKNYGINLNFTISYSMTNFINQHMSQLCECIHRQFEYDILELFLNNPDARISGRVRNVNDEILRYELKSFEGDTVINKLKKAYKRMKSTIDKLGYKDSSFVENIDDNFSLGSI